MVSVNEFQFLACLPSSNLFMNEPWFFKWTHTVYTSETSIMSETSIRDLKTLATSPGRISLLQLNGTRQKWSDYSLVQNIVVAGACLQCVNGNMAVSQTN